ncbi:hypothetical protein JG687_00018434 [Phytophthora cactorum]|uniref:Uncharacterized protein n=1 Tax=Phytophthora cactorum TaxID=29920 RepID=A0A8T1TKP5_9STRA|nr:hypothetical protein JG687_00018434 [Phytophthora cactorum]
MSIRALDFLLSWRLTHIWLGRAPSNTFQEHVYSTGCFVMSSLRIRTSIQHNRTKHRVLLKANWREIRRMEPKGKNDPPR